MSISYETKRTNFDKIVKKYKEYIAIYKRFNNGSAEGITPFSAFYLREIYFSRYLEAQSSELNRF